MAGGVKYTAECWSDKQQWYFALFSTKKNREAPCCRKQIHLFGKRLAGRRLFVTEKLVTAEGVSEQQPGHFPPKALTQTRAAFLLFPSAETVTSWNTTSLTDVFTPRRRLIISFQPPDKHKGQKHWHLNLALFKMCLFFPRRKEFVPVCSPVEVLPGASSVEMDPHFCFAA